MICPRCQYIMKFVPITWEPMEHIVIKRRKQSTSDVHPNSSYNKVTSDADEDSDVSEEKSGSACVCAVDPNSSGVAVSADAGESVP